MMASDLVDQGRNNISTDSTPSDSLLDSKRKQYPFFKYLYNELYSRRTMLNLFKKKSKLLVFIVEDNEMYLRQLTFFLENKFGSKLEIKSFKVAEIALLELDMKPDLIIMDHFLNSKYEDASDGYTVLQGIHAKHPDIKLILHTSQPEVDLAIEAVKSDICEYISKNKYGFERIADTITLML